MLLQLSTIKREQTLAVRDCCNRYSIFGSIGLYRVAIVVRKFLLVRVTIVPQYAVIGLSILMMHKSR